jgi:undecaprenyl-diphosphatase
MWNFLQQTDNWLFEQINTALTWTALDPFMLWISDVHRTWYFRFLIVPFVALCFVKRFKREGVTLFLLLILVLGLNDFIGGRIKDVVERPRPENNPAVHSVQRSEAGDFSFYSNHAANMFAFAAYTGYFFPAAKIPLLGLAAVVSYSRVYNGVHYPSDVLAGSMIGLFLGTLFSGLSARLLTYLKSRKIEE